MNPIHAIITLTQNLKRIVNEYTQPRVFINHDIHIREKDVRDLKDGGNLHSSGTLWPGPHILPGEHKKQKEYNGERPEKTGNMWKRAEKHHSQSPIQIWRITSKGLKMIVAATWLKSNKQKDHSRTQHTGQSAFIGTPVLRRF
jgi:hypothetical protein